MPLKIIWRGHIAHLSGTIKGQRVRESTKTSDPAAAEEIRILRSAEILHRAVHGKRAGLSFAEAALEYLERPGGVPASEKPYVKKLVGHFGDIDVTDIDQAALNAYIRARHVGQAPSTIIRHTITPLSAIINHAAGLRLCDPPKYQRPKEKPPQNFFLTHEEAERLVGAAAPHMKPLLIFLLCTGARISEALYLDWRAVDLRQRIAIFYHTKNGHQRTADLNDDALAALANLPHRVGRVFLTNRGKPYAVRVGGGGMISTGFGAACRRAGLIGVRVHDLRHTYASWMVMLGMPLRTLADMLGHSEPKMTMRYAHLSRSHKAEWANRLTIGMNLTHNSDAS